MKRSDYITFNSLDEFKKAYESETIKLPDEFFLKNNFYVIENYDEEGKKVVYTSIDESKNIILKTKNRYKNHIVEELYKEEIDSLRYDIYYTATKYEKYEEFKKRYSENVNINFDILE